MPQNLLISTYHRLADSSIGGVSAVILGIVVKMVLVSIVTTINKEPVDYNPFYNLLFLLF